MILNQSQAEAAYSAMCALNNLGSVAIDFTLPNGVWVQVNTFGGVCIVPDVHGAKVEGYANQAAFATAYGLQQG